MYPAVHRRSLTNLALKKPASSSSEWDANWKAANGNDGNMDTYWSPKYPKDTADLSWWQVDLQGTPQIVRIELATRPGLPLARYNFEIQASNDGMMQDYIVLGKVSSCDIIPDGGTWVLELPTPVSYRYLRAMKTVKERNVEVDFAIADFRVIGY
jgi:hypothetical protein